MLAALTVWLGATAGDAKALTVPLRENACLSGQPVPNSTELANCPPSAPHEGDLGRAIATVTSPDERNAYVIEQAYTVNTGGGGEAPRARDTIVQEHLNGEAPPSFAHPR